MAAVSQARWAVQLTEDEVVRAVRSLYDDQVKPYGRILIRRIGEHAIERAPERRGGPPPFISAKTLRGLCEDSRRVLVHWEDLKEYSVTLVGPDYSHVFVDPADKRDPYPQELWDELAAYFADGGAGCSEVLPASRYSCAQALASLGLPCLRGRSLGELNHVVALAMTSSRSILGYKDGRVVPYRASDASVREQCAAHALPVPSLPDAPQGVATWETVRVCLRELLSRAGGEIKLPNVKRLFRSEFGVQLSETALGYQRFQDLLQDPRLSDICALHRRESVHVVLGVEAPACPLILFTTPRAAAAAAPPAPHLHDADQEGTPADELYAFGECGPPGRARQVVLPPALQASGAVFAACLPGLPALPCHAFVGATFPIPCPVDLEVQAQEWKRWAQGDEEETRSKDSPWDYAGSGDGSSSRAFGRSRARSEGDATCPICLVPLSEAEERFMESPWILPSASPPASQSASGTSSPPGAAAGLCGVPGGRPGRFAAMLEAHDDNDDDDDDDDDDDGRMEAPMPPMPSRTRPTWSRRRARPQGGRAGRCRHPFGWPWARRGAAPEPRRREILWRVGLNPQDPPEWLVRTNARESSSQAGRKAKVEMAIRGDANDPDLT